MADPQPIASNIIQHFTLVALLYHFQLWFEWPINKATPLSVWRNNIRKDHKNSRHDGCKMNRNSLIFQRIFSNKFPILLAWYTSFLNSFCSPIVIAIIISLIESNAHIANKQVSNDGGRMTDNNGIPCWETTGTELYSTKFSCDCECICLYYVYLIQERRIVFIQMKCY